jgi:ribulose-phosphate 3-epimerase
MVNRTHPRNTVAPSLLAADFCKLGEEIATAEAAGAQMLHLDIMDGQFVPPLSFGEPVLKAIRETSSVFLETHLMTLTPENRIKPLVEIGIDRIIIHQEVSPHAHRVLQQIKDHGCSAGIALNPGTPVANVLPVLELCDVVLIMTVNPGWGGQKFIHSTLAKIREARAVIKEQNFSTLIEVDGGITSDTITEAASAGANLFVAGSALFGASTFKSAFETLTKKSAPQ